MNIAFSYFNYFCSFRFLIICKLLKLQIKTTNMSNGTDQLNNTEYDYLIKFLALGDSGNTTTAVY